MSAVVFMNDDPSTTDGARDFFGYFAKSWRFVSSSNLDDLDPLLEENKDVKVAIFDLGMFNFNAELLNNIIDRLRDVGITVMLGSADLGRYDSMNIKSFGLFAGEFVNMDVFCKQLEVIEGSASRGVEFGE